MNREVALASDLDREQAVAWLREACVEGRLTLEELSQRVSIAYAARTQGDLAPLTSDIAVASRAAPTRRNAVRRMIAVMGSVKHKGRWRAAEQITAVAVMGNCELDLRRAELDSLDVTIDAYALMGEIKVIVPAGVEVDLTGVAFMGEKKYDVEDDTLLPDGPVVRVRANVCMGGVKVESEPHRTAVLRG